MTETERTAIVNWDDTDPELVSIVATTTPWVNGMVILNADGSDI